MILDAQLMLSDAQAVTAAAGSTNTIDLSTVRDIGSGEPLYLVVSVQTALTDGGSNTGTTVALQGDSTTTFTPDGTFTIGSFPQAAAAGTTIIHKLNPGSAPLQFQYIRLLYTPTGANLTGGAFDAFITKDISRYVAYANNYTIS
jgi:hypothetical protein